MYKKGGSVRNAVLQDVFQLCGVVAQYGGRWRAVIALLVVRLEAPGWGKVLNWARSGSRSEAEWHGAPTVAVRAKNHGYLMQLRLDRGRERAVCFLGRFEELETVLVLKHLVEEGDLFVGIGANMGMVSLLASHLVGNVGRVVSFEPSPVESIRLTEHIRINNIQNVEVRLCALGRSKGSAKLKILDNLPGLATLADASAQDGMRVTATYDVMVECGDDLLMLEKGRRTFVKIDVEGWEYDVLQGMETFLRVVKPVVLTELVPAWLGRAGVNAGEVEAFMRRLGYCGYVVKTRRKWGRHVLVLRSTSNLAALNPLQEDIEDGFRNVLWLMPGDERYSNIEGFVS